MHNLIWNLILSLSSKNTFYFLQYSSAVTSSLNGSSNFLTGDIFLTYYTSISFFYVLFYNDISFFINYSYSKSFDLLREFYVYWWSFTIWDKFCCFLFVGITLQFEYDLILGFSWLIDGIINWYGAAVLISVLFYCPI